MYGKIYLIWLFLENIFEFIIARNWIVGKSRRFIELRNEKNKLIKMIHFVNVLISVCAVRRPYCMQTTTRRSAFPKKKKHAWRARMAWALMQKVYKYGCPKSKIACFFLVHCSFGCLFCWRGDKSTRINRNNCWVDGYR